MGYGKAWSASDLLLLADLYLVRRWGTADIAAHMNRSKGSVRMKITTIGLPMK